MVNPEGMGVVDTDDVGIVEERLRILNKMQRTTQVIRVVGVATGLCVYGPVHEW